MVMQVTLETSMVDSSVIIVIQVMILIEATKNETRAESCQPS